MTTNQPTNQRIIKPTHQPTNKLTRQPPNLPTPTNQTKPTNQPTHVFFTRNVPKVFGGAKPLRATWKMGKLYLPGSGQREVRVGNFG